MKTDRADKRADKRRVPERNDADSGERVAKRLARAGLCSRRDAERWIAEGRVAVNGAVLDSPAVVVRPGDVVAVDGNPIPEAEPSRVWRYHKPAGLVTTARDEKGRDTVFDNLPDDMPRVVSIGRLDLTTEGLLLLTNDGELARHLELPATGWIRRYRVRVHGAVDEARLATLSRGLEIEGVRYGPIEATLDKVQGSNAWLSVGLKEGKNREIRKVMESLGLQVTRLIRLSYGPFQLGKLPEGEVEEIPRRVLEDQIRDFFPESEGDDGEKTRPAKPVGTAVRKPGVQRAGARPGAKPRTGAMLSRGGDAPGDERRADGNAARGRRRPDERRVEGGSRDGKPVGAKAAGAGARIERKTLSLKPRAGRPDETDGTSAGTRSGGRTSNPKPRSGGPDGIGVKTSRIRSDSRDAMGRGPAERDGRRRTDAKREGAEGETPRRSGPKREGLKREGPRREGADGEAPRRSGPKREGLKREGPRREGAEGETPRRSGPKREGPKRESQKREGPRGKDDANRRR